MHSSGDLDNVILLLILLLVACVVAAATRMRVSEHRTKTKRCTALLRPSKLARCSPGDCDGPAAPPSTPFLSPFWNAAVPPADAILANVLAGGVAGFKLCLGCMVFASMVYNSCDACHPELRTAFPKGIGVNLLSAATGVVLSSSLSRHGGLVSPQDMPAMILGQIAKVSAEHLEGTRIEPTILAATWCNAVLFGALAFLVGACKAGRLLRTIPCPVLDGFVAATGAMAVRSALSTLSRTRFHSLWPTQPQVFAEVETWQHILVGCLAFVSVRYLSGWIKGANVVKNKLLQSLVGPFCLLLPLIVFYLVLAWRRRLLEDLAALRARDWVFPEVPSQSVREFFTVTYPRSHTAEVDWATFLRTDVLVLGAVLQCLSLVTAVLCIVSLKNRIPGAEGLDVDRELMLLGVQNVVIGGLGGSISFHQMSLSVNIIIDGGTHKLAEFVCALSVAGVFFSGVAVSPFMPRFYLAAIFLNLGFCFVKDHLLDKFTHLSAADFGTMLVVVLLALIKDMTWAVAAGLIMQVAILVMISSTLDPIRLQATTDTMMSTRLRTVQERKILMESGLIEVFCLRGPLFFGIASRLVLDIEELLYNTSPSPWHVILNLDQITALDHSAAEAISQICGCAAKREAQLSITGADEWRWLLVREKIVRDTRPPGEGRGRYSRLINSFGAELDAQALGPQERPGGAGAGALAQWYETLDKALEDCEDQILEQLGGEELMMLTSAGALSLRTFEPASIPAAKELDGAGSRHLVKMSGMASQDWQDLMEECEPKELTEGEALYLAGDFCSNIYLVTEGCLRITLAHESTNKIVTALALLGIEARVLRLSTMDHAAVVLSKTATVQKLSRLRLETMRQNKPSLYIAFTDLWAFSLCSKGRTLGKRL